MSRKTYKCLSQKNLENSVVRREQIVDARVCAFCLLAVKISEGISIIRFLLLHFYRYLQKRSHSYSTYQSFNGMDIKNNASYICTILIGRKSALNIFQEAKQAI